MSDETRPEDENRGPQTAGRKATTAPPADLSAEIVASVDRSPGDVVKCTRVGGATYRCNWWAPQPSEGYDNPNLRGPTYGTHVIRQSRFIRATKTSAGLQMVDASARGDDR